MPPPAAAKKFRVRGRPCIFWRPLTCSCWPYQCHIWRKTRWNLYLQLTTNTAEVLSSRVIQTRTDQVLWPAERNYRRCSKMGKASKDFVKNKNRSCLMTCGRDLQKILKQPAFVFYGRFPEGEAPASGGRTGRHRPFTKRSFLWLINRIRSSRATV